MDTLVFVGTYTERGSEGIYSLRMRAEDGSLERIGTSPAGRHPSYLAVGPTRRTLYAVSEVADVGGVPGGAVQAFRLERESGSLVPLGTRSTRSGGPCYLSTDAEGKVVLVASYGGGAVSVLPVGAGGELADASDVVQHPAPTIARERQDAPHAHCVVVGPENTHAFAADLGLNRIMVYVLDAAAGKLRPHRTPWVELHPGAGPRHLTFHPSGRFAYLINELDNTVCAYRYHGGGDLEYLQRVSTLPEGWRGESFAADIHVSPDGRFVYGSNRGHDSIVAYEVDERRGALRLLEHQQAGVRWPRGFAVDPSGRFLLVANERSDSVVTFAVDLRTGRTSPTGSAVAVPAPACVKLLSETGACSATASTSRSS